MTITHVHGHTVGIPSVLNAQHALREAGFDSRHVAVRLKGDEPQAPLVITQRNHARLARRGLRSMAMGAAAGALVLAPLGAIAPGALQQLQFAPWFVELINPSVALASVQAGALGGMVGAVVGFCAGLFRMQPDPGRTHFVVDVDAEEAQADAAARALRGSGSDEVWRDA